MFRVILLTLAAFALLGQAASEDASPVKVDLYYETLCPYSREYFVYQLYPTYQLLKDIMLVSLYPFGNANYEATDDGGYTFTCQHGDDECRGNMIHACAQNYLPNIDVEMDFVNCLLSAEYPPNAGPQCAEEVGQDWTPIGACVESVEGEIALHDVALEQEKLDPALYFVPWIVVDDTFSEDQVEACQNDMLAVVCDRYTGETPPACTTTVTKARKTGVKSTSQR